MEKRDLLIMEQVKTIEETDPEFAELIKYAVNINSASPRSIIINGENQVFKRTLSGYYNEIPGNPLPRRNDPCICGSGKKFKKCCLEVNV
jgi:uncharacterized protein YchJ